MTTDFRALITNLSDAGVEFIIVGGVAGTIHGAARATADLDVVYRRTPENMARLVRAIAALSPYPRGAPPGLPFTFDERTMKFGVNFTLKTSLGLIDLLGEITGGGAYDALIPFTATGDVHSRSCRYLQLEKLIAVKRAAGRPKDFEAIAELELIRDTRADDDEQNR
jgi:hypothetical protein